jgi:hypothetical protein
MAFVAEGGLEMARRKHKPEEIVAKLRQVVAEAVRTTGVTEVTYYLYGRLSRCKSISS